MTRAIAAARLLASEPVYKATVELMDAVIAIIQFAKEVLAKDARLGEAGWYLFKKPLPVAQHPGLEEFMDRLGRATTRFIIEAQKEIKVPGKRDRGRAGEWSTFPEPS